jgi:hypothetical protein
MSAQFDARLRYRWENTATKLRSAEFLTTDDQGRQPLPIAIVQAARPQMTQMTQIARTKAGPLSSCPSCLGAAAAARQRSLGDWPVSAKQEETELKNRSCSGKQAQKIPLQLLPA